MQMVTTGIPQIVLHVTNDRILPVQHIQCTIPANLHVTRPKILIRRIQNRLHLSSKKARTTLLKAILSHSLKSNHIRNQQVASVLLRKMLTVQYADRRYRSHSLLIQLGRSSTARHPDVIASSTRPVRRKLIAPLIKHVAMRVRANREMKIDVKGRRIPLVHSRTTRAKPLRRPPRRFKVLGVKNSPRKIKSPPRTHHKRIGRVMGICRVQTMKNSLTHISTIVPVRVLQEPDVRCHRHQHTTVPKFKTRRIMQPVGKRHTTIRNAIRILVRKNQQLVIHRLQRIPVRIRRPCRHPQSSIRIHCTLHRIHQI